MTESLKQRLERYRTELQQERGRYLYDWQQIDSFLYPRPTSRINATRPGQGNRTNELNIINETASFSLGVLRSGLMAGYANPSRPWFKLTLADADLADYYSVKTWLAEVEERLRGTLIKSNFYYVLPNVFGDTAGFGISAMLVLEDDEHGVRYTCPPVGQFSVAMDDRGRPECFYRTVSLTVRQIIARFGAENISDRCKKALEQNRLEELVDVTHAILPNMEALQSVTTGAKFERGADGKVIKSMPWHSVYYETHGQGEQVLQQRGFHEFPGAMPRWDAIDGDTYSTRWPGMTALASIKQLQATERVKFTVHDHQARPAMIADATLKGQKTSIVPGGVSYIENLGMQQHPAYRRAFDINPDTRGMEADVVSLENRIKRAFHEDLMLVFATGDYRQMTAREVAERAQEKIFVLGPTMQRFDTELMDPVLFRTVSVMLRSGMLPEVPQELSGQELKIEYTSIMSQALRQIGASSTETFMAGVANVAKVLGADVLDNVDGDHVVTEYAQQQGVSPKILIPEEQRDARRKERAAAAQQQAQSAQQQAMMQQAGGGAAAGNPMAALMQGQG